MKGLLRRILRLRGRARAVITGGVILALALVATGITAVLLPGQAFAASSGLTVLSGTVEVQAPGTAGFVAASDGALVPPGASVRTGADTVAILTLFDGSTITLDESSELRLDTVSGNGRGDIVIALTQVLGSSWHVVAHKLTTGSQYQVHTLDATASVRGTAFTTTVKKTPDGKATSEISTTDGTVTATTPAGQELAVTPGKKTETDANGALAPVTDAPPVPTVQVVIDPTVTPTANAAAVDGKGRSVGVVNGQPVRYAPGSKVETTSEGKLVMTIPTKDPQRISTVVKTDDASKPVPIVTQFQVNGAVVASTAELRKPDQNGTAKGGVVLTQGGVVVMPDQMAQQFTAPNIAGIPQQQGAGGGFGGSAVAKPDFVPGFVPPVDPQGCGPGGAPGCGRADFNPAGIPGGPVGPREPGGPGAPGPGGPGGQPGQFPGQGQGVQGGFPGQGQGVQGGFPGQVSESAARLRDSTSRRSSARRRLASTRRAVSSMVASSRSRRRVREVRVDQAAVPEARVVAAARVAPAVPVVVRVALEGLHRTSSHSTLGRRSSWGASCRLHHPGRRTPTRRLSAKQAG